MFECGFILLMVHWVLKCIHFCLFPNLWNFRQLFIQVIFLLHFFLFFSDSSYMNLRPFIVILQLPDVLIIYFNLFSFRFCIRSFLLTKLYVHWLFPLSSPIPLLKFFVSNIVLLSFEISFLKKLVHVSLLRMFLLFISSMFTFTSWSITVKVVLESLSDIPNIWIVSRLASVSWLFPWELLSFSGSWYVE